MLMQSLLVIFSHADWIRQEYCMVELVTVNLSALTQWTETLLPECGCTPDGWHLTALCLHTVFYMLLSNIKRHWYAAEPHRKQLSANTKLTFCKCNTFRQLQLNEIKLQTEIELFTEYTIMNNFVKITQFNFIFRFQIFVTFI